MDRASAWLPWRVRPKDRRTVEDKDGNLVAEFNSWRDGEPAYAVRACNAHQELVACLIARLEVCPCGMPKPAQWQALVGFPGLCDLCRAELAALSGAQP